MVVLFMFDKFSHISYGDLMFSYTIFVTMFLCSFSFLSKIKSFTYSQIDCVNFEFVPKVVKFFRNDFKKPDMCLDFRL